MKPGDRYRDLVASYLERNFGVHGLLVYTEVPFGTTIIGKDRKVDVFVLRPSDQSALAIECKWQQTDGTTDEKVPYALQDLEAMWVPGCLTYAGEGWSKGVLHTLKGAKLAVRCLPEAPHFERTSETLELDHVIASVFGLWDYVIPQRRLFSGVGQLPLKGIKSTRGTKKRPKRTAKGGD